MQLPLFITATVHIRRFISRPRRPIKAMLGCVTTEFVTATLDEPFATGRTGMTDNSLPTLHIVGGGLAGSEAAWQALQVGVQIKLYEMRPKKLTAAHKTGDLAELVCSNSMKSLVDHSAPGQLKKEMSGLNSLIIAAAMNAKVPAGQALAVDRQMFSATIRERLEHHPNFEFVAGEITQLPSVEECQQRGEAWLVASGPLTSDALATELERVTEQPERLYFYDAIAPVIAADSIDHHHCFRQSRYDREKAHGDGDYLNIPLSKDQYEAFIDAILTAEYAPLHAFEATNYFESCLPIEVMVERGRETLRFGPMKPVGLTDPKIGHRPWAAIQLRMENTLGTMYSMVGFQTKMKWPEQKKVFGMLPALANAEILRYGSVHRNTYLKSPDLLTNL